MKLSDLNKLFFFLIFFINLSSSYAEDEIDIWKKKPSNKTDEASEKQELKIQSPLINNNIKTSNIIQEQATVEEDNTLLYGIWDPDKYNFELSMWSNTDGKNIQKTISRLNKLKLSKSDYIFHAGTKKKDRKIYAMGGRVLNFVSLSTNFKLAKKNILSNLKKLDWSGGFFRKDIGYKVIKK